MIFVYIGVALLAICFGGVLLVGAPYLPTLSPQVTAALTLAKLKPGETLLELGCGDGKVLIAAARAGYNAVGYELNPIMALIAWARTRRYKKQVRVVCGDFWQTDWPQSAAIFAFLLPRYMDKLDKRILQYNHKPVKLVSFAFKIPEKKINSELAGVFLYNYR
ncbi:class I SAM-dependent methyltransferase [Candidatus Saccharibacteria bacterium]|nr:class I SAM-dependent methyltransferase [Candidatus Saccharibacteria bacterium]